MKMTGHFKLIETEEDLRIVDISKRTSDLIFEKTELPDTLNKMDCALSGDFEEGFVFILNKKCRTKMKVMGKSRRVNSNTELRRRELAYAIDMYMQTGELPE